MLLKVFAVISAEIGIARKELDFLHDNFKRGKIPTEILAASSVGQTNFPAEGTKALSVEIGELQPFQYFKKTFSPF